MSVEPKMAGDDFAVILFILAILIVLPFVLR